ncbi:MAG TPA: ABC transporter ATP-binding protein [Streptosporangiaceae bacterium]|nr:ABC transporter ATP-binding protein [Streptosporangiaceae bacterium]
MTLQAGHTQESAWGVRAVTVIYGERVALRDVTLDVPQGQVTGVVGGDGAGKTTLLRILAGAAAPDSGEVRRPAAERTGYLTATSGTYPDLSVQENLEFAAAGYGVPAKQARARTQEYLERTGLAAAQRRLVGNLSGGMRQKLGVIRAMLHKPDLLVLDEPTTGVDPVSRADLWWLIARAAAGGAAVVLTTTYLDEAERAASVLVLDDGEQLTQGTPDEIVAGVKGTIRISPERPRGEVARRAWRRGGTWRVWSPPGALPGGALPGGSGVDGTRSAQARPDLQDAVIVAALARELTSGAAS